jgi:hypothetical protein
MARKTAAAKPTTEAADAAPETAPLALPPAEQPRQPAGEAAKPPYAADPAPGLSISLSDHRGGPAMHLLRSHKFHQMQIRFDREQPDEKHLARLKQAGWKDRTESEGVWTKQIDRDRRWQSVQDMEQEFKNVANAIRKGKGLAPALEGPSPA